MKKQVINTTTQEEIDSAIGLLTKAGKIKDWKILI